MPFVAEADVAVRLPGQHARRRPTCAATSSSRPRCVPARTRSTRATASCPRTPTSPAHVLAAGLTWVGPTPESMEQDGHQGRGQEADGRGRRARAHRAQPRQRSPRPTCRCWSRQAAVAAAAACASSATSPSSPAPSSWLSTRPRRAFGDPTVFCEPYVERGRHVEVQVVGDTPRQRARARRPRLLAAAPPPEGRRGGAAARPAPTTSAADAPRGGVARPARRSATSAPARWSSSFDGRPGVLLPGDEHPAAGRAPGHRVRHRRRPGRSAGRRGRGRRRPVPATRQRVAGHARRGAAVRRGPGPRLPAAERAAHPLRDPGRDRASSSTARPRHPRSTPGSGPATRSARTTTR